MQPNPEKVRQIMMDSMERQDLKKSLKTLYRDYNIDNSHSIILTLYKSQVEITSVDISPSCCSDVAVDDSIPVIDQELTKFPQRLIAEYLQNINENDHQFLDALGIDGSEGDIELKLQFVPLETPLISALGVDSIENNLAPSSSQPFFMTAIAACRPGNCGRSCCFPKQR